MFDFQAVSIYGLLLAFFASDSHALSPRTAQSINFQQLVAKRSSLQSQYLHGQTIIGKGPPFPEFPPQTFTQPLDHDNPSSPTFEQRYWVNTRHYKKGGPVIVIDGGETSGEDRLPFLDAGIADILAKATHGLGVVLEHRYYGESIPVNNLTTDSLRWLNNYQALSDSAHFMKHVNFSSSLFPRSVSSEIISDLRAPHSPWIYYGGSYAGARAAHMRLLYPDIVFGAIASSAVTHATIINWEYMDIIRTAAPRACSALIQASMSHVDAMLVNATLREPIKTLFGLEELEHDTDFVSVLSWPLNFFQGKNWDPNVNERGFDEFCAKLTSKEDDALLVQLESEWRAVHPGNPISFAVLRHARYIRNLVENLCPAEENIEDCFGTHDDEKFRGTGLHETWRLWTFQVCTEWGYFVTAPPDPEWPSMISRLTDVHYESKICRQAFPPGEFMHVPKWPNVTVVNALGDFGLTHSRLAFIDGEIDPWRPCTPHSQYAPSRKDTTSRPFKLIPDGVHHHDQNGLKIHKEEPKHIQKIHHEEVEFVKAWLKEWKPSK